MTKILEFFQILESQVFSAVILDLYRHHEAEFRAEAESDLKE